MPEYDGKVRIGVELDNTNVRKGVQEAKKDISKLATEADDVEFDKAGKDAEELEKDIKKAKKETEKLKEEADKTNFDKAKESASKFKDNIEKAMEPLYTTVGGERAGLGFAVMQSFTDKITVRSVVGKGTTVTLTKKISQRFGVNG